MSLHVEISHQRDVLLVRLDGELDHHSATEVRGELTGNGPKEFMDI